MSVAFESPAVLGLAVNKLNAWYGQAHILFDMALEVKPGEVVALLGRNGAGKSTTFRSIMGLVPKVEGGISFNNVSIAGLPTYEIVRRGLGYVPEDRRIFTDLTVEENLSVGVQPPRPGLEPWTPERLYDVFPNLRELRGRQGGRMSGGEQQMLTIARTLMGNPSLVLLDEPSEGLAPKIIEQMAEIILKMKASGLSLVISEQNLHFARLISDRVAVIEKGAVRYAGTMADFQARPDIRDAFLAV